MKAADLFGGYGGFQLGAILAGVDVVYAANHDPLCVRTSKAANPSAEHVCQDLRQADWTTLPAFDLLLASPACQGHSRGSQPRRRRYHDAMRATAWAVVDCAEVTRPSAVIVENVPSFVEWELFPLWREAWRLLGYHFSERVLTATRFGVPQRRDRWFATCTRKPGAIELPTGAPEVEPAFEPLIDWAAPGWRRRRKASPGAQRRMNDGEARCGRRFLSQHTTGHKGVPLSEPIRTITTKDQWVLVDGDCYRPLTMREYARGMDFPDSFRLPAAARSVVVRGLGNAVPRRMAAAVIAATARAA